MRKILALLVGLAIAGCGVIPVVEGPTGGAFIGPLIPDGTLQVTPTKAYSFEALGGIALAADLIFIVYDPLAPNWSIKETVINDETYHLALEAKSFRTGGDGESMMILKRRALKLQREKGFSGYRILDYSEGIASSTPFTHRFSEGTIQLVRAETVSGRP